MSKAPRIKKIKHTKMKVAVFNKVKTRLRKNLSLSDTQKIIGTAANNRNRYDIAKSLLRAK